MSEHRIQDRLRVEGFAVSAKVGYEAANYIDELQSQLATQVNDWNKQVVASSKDADRIAKLQAQLEGANKQHKADVEELHERLLTIGHERGKRTKLEAQADRQTEYFAELEAKVRELQAQLVEIPSPADLYSEIESLQKQLEAVRLLPDMFDSKFHHQHIGTDAYKQGAKEAYGTAAYELRAAIGEVES